MSAGTAQSKPQHWACLLSLLTAVQFVETNKELLADLPPPMAAAAYYRNEDLYMVGVSTECLFPLLPACGGLWRCAAGPWERPPSPFPLNTGAPQAHLSTVFDGI